MLGGASVTPNRTSQDMGRPQSVSLPLILQPSRGRAARRRFERRAVCFAASSNSPCVPARPRSSCAPAAKQSSPGAVPHGAVSVSAASAGRLGRAGNALVAPISVSIEYLRQGGIERRQARVNCLLTKEGTVVALR